MAADPGTYDWTGTDASLFFGGEVNAEAGSFLWTGSDAEFIRGATAEALNLGSGLLKGRSYPRAFHPAHRKPFKQSGGNPNYLISADVGSYVWTGVDTTLSYAPVASGTAVPFHFKTKTHPRPFMPSPYGALRSSPPLGNLLVGVTGPNVTLTAEGGTWTWTGQNATLLAARLVGANAGSYLWTGSDVTNNYGKTLTGDAGSYIWTGTDASLEGNFEIVPDSGEYLWTGADATLISGTRFISAEAGSFIWTGTAATLLNDKHMDGDAAEYIWLVSDANLVWSAQPGGAGGKMLLMGVG
jgi:hypothetical protein